MYCCEAANSYPICSLTASWKPVTRAMLTPGRVRSGAMRIAAAGVLAVAALVVAGCGSKSQSLPKPPETAVMTMTVKNGKPVGGIKRFTVEKGKPLSIVVYSDVADEVHLHGYDKHVDVAPGPGPSIMHF